MNIDKNYLVIRHSIREEITDVNDSERQRLTKGGIEFAKQLGKFLSKYSGTFSFYHSPIPRCEETANFIKEGIESQSKKVINVSAFETLSGFFIGDFKIIANICHQEGHIKYLQKWFENRLDPKVVMPCSEAADVMYNKITGIKLDNVTKIFITHDWNLFCLKSLFIKNFEDVEIPNYLEGLIINKNKKEFKLFKQKNFINSN